MPCDPKSSSRAPRTRSIGEARVITDRGRRELNVIRRRRTEFLERRLLTLSPAERQKAVELVAFLETLLEEE